MCMCNGPSHSPPRTTAVSVPLTDKHPSSPEVEHEDVGLMQAHEYRVEHPVSTGKGVGVHTCGSRCGCGCTCGCVICLCDVLTQSLLCNAPVADHSSAKSSLGTLQEVPIYQDWGLPE